MEVGLLVEWDEANKAWKVRMEDGSGKAFRPVNLEPHRPTERGAPQGTKSSEKSILCFYNAI